MFIANRADDRILEPTLFGKLGHEQALHESESGRALHHILKEVNLSFDDIYFTNVFKCLLPGNREPTKQEYKICSEVLEAQVQELKPRVIVCCGRRAYESIFPDMAEIHDFDEALNQLFLAYSLIPTLITYHLSRIERMQIDYRRKIHNFIRQNCKAEKSPAPTAKILSAGAGRYRGN
jgi:uracil-DNA glycosylase family 4